VLWWKICKKLEGGWTIFPRLPSRPRKRFKTTHLFNSIIFNALFSIGIFACLLPTHYKRNTGFRNWAISIGLVSKTRDVNEGWYLQPKHRQILHVAQPSWPGAVWHLHGGCLPSALPIFAKIGPEHALGKASGATLLCIRMLSWRDRPA